MTRTRQLLFSRLNGSFRIFFPWSRNSANSVFSLFHLSFQPSGLNLEYPHILQSYLMLALPKFFSALRMGALAARPSLSCLGISLTLLLRAVVTCPASSLILCRSSQCPCLLFCLRSCLGLSIPFLVILWLLAFFIVATLWEIFYGKVFVPICRSFLFLFLLFSFPASPFSSFLPFSSSSFHCCLEANPQALHHSSLEPCQILGFSLSSLNSYPRCYLPVPLLLWPPSVPLISRWFFPCSRSPQFHPLPHCCSLPFSMTFFFYPRVIFITIFFFGFDFSFISLIFIEGNESSSCPGSS